MWPKAYLYLKCGINFWKMHLSVVTIQDKPSKVEKNFKEHYNTLIHYTLTHLIYLALNSLSNKNYINGHN